LENIIVNGESLFINVVDKVTHDSMMQLHQQLQTVLDKLRIKREGIKDAQSLDAQRLEHLSKEIEQAFVSIQTMTQMVIKDELSVAEFNQLNYDELESFREMLVESNEKFSNIAERIATLSDSE